MKTRLITINGHCLVQICNILFYVSHNLTGAVHCVRYTKTYLFQGLVSDLSVFKKGVRGGGRGIDCLNWQVQGSKSGGWFEVLWNLECPVGLSQKRNMCAFQ